MITLAVLLFKFNLTNSSKSLFSLSVILILPMSVIVDFNDAIISNVSKKSTNFLLEH